MEMQIVWPATLFLVIVIVLLVYMQQGAGAGKWKCRLCARRPFQRLEATFVLLSCLLPCYLFLRIIKNNKGWDSKWKCILCARRPL